MASKLIRGGTIVTADTTFKGDVLVEGGIIAAIVGDLSGAGHDACWINRVAPTAMVFCPCVDGLSHNEDEEISPEWAEAGANVLFHAAVETAGIVS